MTDFAHLHVHTCHSQLDGLGTPKDYAQAAAQLGQTALAITDHGNVDGVLKFQAACSKQGVTPILGCELYMCQDRRVKDDQRYHIVALVRSREGLTNLMKMITVANLEGFHKRPRIDRETLLAHTEGLVFLTACIGSFLNMPGGEDFLLALEKLAPTYLEIMPHQHLKQLEHNNRLIKLSTTYGIPLVATNDCHYPYWDMQETQEVLLAMKRGAKWSDKDRWTMRDWPGLFLRSAEEMDRAFEAQSVLVARDWRQAMANTMEIVGLCNGYTVERVKVELPKVHGHENRDETDLMWEIVGHGWETRQFDPGHPVEEYQDRVNEEMALICQMGFQRYFLIVWELIKWCRDQGIMVGPGRGSSGGSLVCYLMGITDVDPLKYGLIFARFISPERIDYPDIDMDFESARRDEVMQHLRDCYGEYGVVNLSTFSTMKGRGALRDVSRVFEIPNREVDPVAKALHDYADGHDRHGHILEDSLRDFPEVKDFERRYPEPYQHAINLEGQIKGYGKHAAGMAINDKDLRLGHHCSLRVYNGVITANWDKNDAEYMGLMKLDVLGIYNLSYLNEAARMVWEIHGEAIEFDQIPLDDLKVYREIAAGNCAGAFQIGSALNIKYCKELGVREFNDIVLINALTRPGPLGSGVTDTFLRRRHGHEPVEYIHPRMEEYTRDTLGLVIFQEQVMWVMFHLAGMSWAECDKVRKVMGKSKGAGAFQKFKDQFVSGCTAQGTLPPRDASHVWDQLASFGSYGFNLSHAVEYSLLGYWCMWMKVHWPMEFLCGCLSHCKKEDSPKFVDEARRLGISIELPKQGVSRASKWIAKDGVLWAPVMAIKGVGDHQADKILNGKVREKTPEKKKKKQDDPRGFFLPGLFDDPVVQSPVKPQETKAKKSSTMETLEKAGYYRERDLTWDELQAASHLYDFNILTGNDRFKCLGSLPDIPERDLLACRMPTGINLIEITRYLLEEIECRDCGLISECTKPVQPSFGRYNLMIIGEAPGKKENELGMGFVGSAGEDKLWPALAKYGLTPTMFHVTNVCKCWPSKTRTPGRKHISSCSKWLEKEIKGLGPVMILALGGIAVKALGSPDGKISELNGRTEWSDRYQCWISWCLHPAAVLHNPKSQKDFEDGIENFAHKLWDIGGQVWASSTYETEVMDCPYGGDFGDANSNYAVCGKCQVWEQCAAHRSKADWSII